MEYNPDDALKFQGRYWSKTENVKIRDMRRANELLTDRMVAENRRK